MYMERFIYTPELLRGKRIFVDYDILKVYEKEDFVVHGILEGYKYSSSKQ